MSGARLLDENGARILDDDGARVLDDDAGNDCCCGLCAECDRYPEACWWCDQDDGIEQALAHAPTRYQMVMVGVEQTTGEAIPVDPVETLNEDYDLALNMCRWWALVPPEAVEATYIHRRGAFTTRFEAWKNVGGLDQLFFKWEGPNPTFGCCSTLALENQLAEGEGLGINGTVTLIPCGGGA